LFAETKYSKQIIKELDKNGNSIKRTDVTPKAKIEALPFPFPSPSETLAVILI
jgi:hypothetical protein